MAFNLTRDEASRLKSQMEWLLAHPDEHFHFSDETDREISVSLYDPTLLNDPDAMSRYNPRERVMFDEM